MSPKNKEHYQSEKEAIHLLLTGTGDEIYSTVDACKTAHEIFVTIVKQQHELDTVSYHKLFDVLKQYQKEVNKIRAERIAKNANPLALQSSSTRSNASTRHKGKEIAKPITPPSESHSDEDSDLEQAQKDKEMQKNLALIAKYFKKIYKPTNNNLITSSNSKNKNVDNSPRCPLQVEQSNWLADTDEEIDEKELEAYYSYIAKIQEVPTADSRTYTEPLEKVDSNVIFDSSDMCNDDIQTDQNAKECDDERQVKKANASLTHELKECKSILAETSRTLEESNSTRDSCLIALQGKQTELETYKTLNDRTTDYDELEFVKEKHNELVKHSFLTKSHHEGLVKEKTKIARLILFIVDSGCRKHITGNLKLLCNFVEKYLGTIRFGNDQFAPILGYGDLVAFQKSTCFVRDLQGNDLLTGNRGSDLYKISLQEMISSTPICFMAKASPTQAWLWHQRLSHLNFDYINLLLKKYIMIGLPKLKYVKDQLCSFCEVSKVKRSSFKTKAVPSSKGRLNQLYMDLCGPMRVESINGKKYILNDVVERRNHTLVEATRMMLSASNLPLFFWDEAITTAFYTQNRSIIIPTYEKTAYHIINDRKPSIRHLHIFGCTCYLTRDGENPNKIKEKVYSGTSSVNKSSSPTDNSKQDTTPTMNIQSSTEPLTLTITVNAEENKDNQAEDTQFQQDEFINPFCTPVREIAESSS
ncbi:retrovirus-related pol polyprotein from transposon TNT 1-94 [Tanacetum coccineum]